jgi:uncharacterized protein YggE
MNTLRGYLSTILVFLAGALIGVACLLLVQYIKGPKQTVSVVGTGVVEATADQANLNIQISNTSLSLQAAQEATKKDVLELKSALQKLNIPPSQITENSYENAPPMPYELTVDSIAPSRPLVTQGESTAYTDLNLTLTSISGIEKVFAAVNSQKHAKLAFTNYSLVSAAKYQDGAREKALKNARAQVESIAKINKLHVGKLVSIADTNSAVGPMQTKGMMMNATLGGGEQVTYGEKTIPVETSFKAIYELY